MRYVLFLLTLCLSSLCAEDLSERLTLTDGRVLVGIYDPVGERIQVTTGNLKAQIPVHADQIAKREPVVPPVAPPTAAELRALEAAEQAQVRADADAKRAAERVANDAAIAATKRQRENEAQKLIDDAAAEAKATLADRAQHERDESLAAKMQRDAITDAVRHAREAKAAASAKLVEAQQAQAYQKSLNDAEARHAQEQAAIVEEKQSHDRAADAGLAIAVIVAIAAFFLAILLPAVVALFRRHRFQLQIDLITGVCVVVCILAMNMAGEGTRGIVLAIIALPWMGALVWATWPGLGKPPLVDPLAPNRPANRRHAVRPKGQAPAPTMIPDAEVSSEK